MSFKFSPFLLLHDVLDFVSGHAAVRWLCPFVGLCFHGRMHCECSLAKNLLFLEKFSHHRDVFAEVLVPEAIQP